ncbi:hypothetical protein PQO03_00055 [Lentisphaera profundi]|uniref:Lipoprotein n=1 Tax=Lentisphaera profundi TaxID=1658616 RepID=A0ABY7VQA0_9BACT|nr:hypothetical protein [Lentisphaera profundi]WDE96360.1 hypothetical protein PQO03_00055 [Lentisphaera profundi]
MNNFYKALPLALLMAACNQGPDQATVSKNVENEIKQKYAAEIKAEVEAKVMANIKTELDAVKNQKQALQTTQKPASELNEEEFYIEALKYKDNSSFISAACYSLKNYPASLPTLVKFVEDNINESYASYPIDTIMSFSSDPKFKGYITQLSELEGNLSGDSNYRGNIYKIQVKRVEIDPSYLPSFIAFLNQLAKAEGNYISYLDRTFAQALKLNGYAKGQEKKQLLLALINIFPKVNGSYDLKKAYKVLVKLTGQTLGSEKYDDRQKTGALYLDWAKKNLN